MFICINEWINKYYCSSKYSKLVTIFCCFVFTFPVYIHSSFLPKLNFIMTTHGVLFCRSKGYLNSLHTLAFYFLLIFEICHMMGSYISSIDLEARGLHMKFIPRSLFILKSKFWPRALYYFLARRYRDRR